MRDREKGAVSLVGLLVGLIISALVGIGILEVSGDLIADGSATNALNQRLAGYAIAKAAAGKLLPQAGYVGLTSATAPTASTDSSTASAPSVIAVSLVEGNTGIRIQWVPSALSSNSSTPGAASLCQGSLTDASVPQVNGLALHGLLWTVQTVSGPSGYCHSAHILYLAGDHWIFHLSKVSGCSGPAQEAVQMTNSEDTAIGRLNGNSGHTNTETITTCLPNATSP